jgi:hypothetical protein
MPDQPPAYRWQRGALYWRHKRGIDLVPGSGITVHDDKVAKFFPLSVRQPVPCKPGRNELRLPAIFRERPRRQDRGQRRRPLERTVGVPELVRSISERLAVGFTN